jgi:hypothetical protein
MNSFANPADASPYVFPEFAAPEKEKLDISFSEELNKGKFKEFEVSQQETVEENLPIVQSATLQDFKQVLSSSPS